MTQANVVLPFGVQSFAHASRKNKWLIVGGRLNGLHGFATTGQNFPAVSQNVYIMVVTVNRSTKQEDDAVVITTQTRSLLDAGSDLSIPEIDSLTVTASQFFQRGNTLFITGGYGIDTLTQTFTTKPILTAINIPRLIKWVSNPAAATLTAQSCIRQHIDPLFQVTGGEMIQIERSSGSHRPYPMLLIMGQLFNGEYKQGATQVYTQQVRRFDVEPVDWKKQDRTLNVHFRESLPPSPGNPVFRRRDLNITPFVSLDAKTKKLKFEVMQLGGVFTEQVGVWTRPVRINARGAPAEVLEGDFRQAMSHYDCARVTVYSRSKAYTYVLLFGGISYGQFLKKKKTTSAPTVKTTSSSSSVSAADACSQKKSLTFETDPEIPFINQCTAIRIDHYGVCTQFLLNDEFPFIAPGITLLDNSDPAAATTVADGAKQKGLLFGASAGFFVNRNFLLFQSHYKLLIWMHASKEKPRLIILILDMWLVGLLVASQTRKAPVIQVHHLISSKYNSNQTYCSN
jgi:hypothetical protein